MSKEELIGHIEWDKYIWVEKKGKLEKFMEVDTFEKQLSAKLVDVLKISKDEASKRVRESLFLNPEAILDILRTVDSEIEGWKIPSHIVKNK